MFNACRLVLLISLLIGVFNQCYGFTIEPGVYHLKWRPNLVRNNNHYFECMEPVSKADAPKFSGLQSENACWIEKNHYILAVDESKGAENGYDTAYLFIKPLKSEMLDVKDAVKIELVKNDWDMGEQISNKSVMVTLTFGKPDEQVTKQSEVSVTVQVNKDDKDTPCHASVNFGGGWYARVETEIGPVRITTKDNNGNGLFNDRTNANGSSDAVVIESRKDSPENSLHDNDYLYLGTASMLDGKLYVVNVSSTGDTVEIQPYKGETGLIKVEVIDGHHDKIDWSYGTIYSKDCHFSIKSEDGEEYEVPIGDYWFSMQILPKQEVLKDEDSRERDRFEIHLSSLRDDEASATRVEKDRTSVLHVGGAISVGISNGCCSRCSPPDMNDTVKINRSKDSRIFIAYMFEYGATYGWWSYDLKDKWKATVLIKDSNGNVIDQVESDCSFGVTRLDTLKSCKPGIYTLEITAEFAKYQPPISVTKTVELVD